MSCPKIYGNNPKGKTKPSIRKGRHSMIIEWLWDKRGFSFPKIKTETKSTQAKIKSIKVSKSGKKRKR
jgi:hypothetical protein